MFFTNNLINSLNILKISMEGGFWNSIFLKLVQAIYGLVSDIYGIFLTIAKLKMSEIAELMSGLISSVKAIIIILVIYKLGIMLVTALINNKSGKDAIGDGKKFIVNILIATALLIGSNLIFGLFNDATMLLLGTNEGDKFEVLGDLAGLTDGADEGLIMRFVFGKDKSGQIADAGEALSYNILCAMYPDKGGGGCTALDKSIRSTSSGSYNGKDISKIENVSGSLEKTIEPHTFLAIILGLYLCYTLFITSIEVGVRAFKLIILQMLAPLAFVSIISKEGTKDKMFKTFTGEYIKTYVSAFTRILVMLLTTVIVSKILSNGLSTIAAAKEKNGVAITVILIIAAFKFVKSFPEFIGKLFESKFGKIGTDGSLKGFGNLMGGLVGAGTGGLAGAISGAATGGVLGGIAGFAKGTTGGFSSGLKGKDISEKVKNLSENRKKVATANAAQAARVAAYGGGIGGWARDIGYRAASATGIPGMIEDNQVSNYDNMIQPYNDMIAAANAYEKEQVAIFQEEKVSSAIKSNQYTTGIGDGAGGYKSFAEVAKGFDSTVPGFDNVKFTDNKDAFASSMLKYNSAYNQAKATYDQTKSEGDLLALNNAEAEAIEDAKALWQAAKDYQAGHESERMTLEREEFEKLGTKVGYTGPKISETKKAKESINANIRHIEVEKDRLKRSNMYKASHGQQPASKK